MVIDRVNLVPGTALDGSAYLSSPVEGRVPCSRESWTVSQRLPWANVQCFAPTQPEILHARSEASSSARNSPLN